MADSYFRQLWEHTAFPGGIQLQTDDAAEPSAVRIGRQQGVYVYQVPGGDLAHGSSLGNDRTWIISKGSGAIEGIYSIADGLTIAGAFAVSYFTRARELSPYGWPRAGGMARRDPDSLVMLTAADGADVLLHPAYQQRRQTLLGQLEVLETLFLPRAAGEDPRAAYYHTEVRNASTREATVIINASLDPQGDTALDLAGRMLEGTGVLVWNAGQPRQARLLASRTAPERYVLTQDVDDVTDPSHLFTNDTTARGRAYAGLQHAVRLAPGDHYQVTFIVAFTAEGEAALIRDAAGLPDAETALRQTVAWYAPYLFTSAIATPDTLINQGAQWCKANALRVLARYPTGLAFTNNPGESSHVVARDVTWYAYGADSFYPEACCDMYAMLARLQTAEGKIVEYYDALTGAAEDYGLNINDNTPLFVLGVAHHLRQTGHARCTALIEPMCRAVDYLLSQRDERGLVVCTATGTGEQGICGWRNVMTGEQISGAVTEINSECYAALVEAAALIAGTQPERAARYRREADALKAAINRHLVNPRTGLYLLNSEPGGAARTDVTADLVFPLIFNVADDATAHLISTRLNSPDMMTSAGIRTVSTQNPYYHPDRVSGLMGGVWPGVTWWYATGNSLDDPRIMVESLRHSYRQYLRNPRVYNTVPGQFSEWFHGESLVNRGMRLSPWEPPRFLWSMIEGALGIAHHGESFTITPHIPPAWTWLAVGDFPYRGRAYSWFMMRMAGQRTFFTATPFKSEDEVRCYDDEVREGVALIGDHACAHAYRRGRELLVALGSESRYKAPVMIELSPAVLRPERQYTLSVYTSELDTWDELGARAGGDLQRLSIWVEKQGAVLLQFVEH